MAKKLTKKPKEEQEKKIVKPAALLMEETKEEKKLASVKAEKAAVTEVKASLKYLKISARKVKPVADSIRGLNAEEALRRLSLIHKGAALPIKKLIESALANAAHNFKLNRADLMIKNMIVGQAPSLKRFSPAAFGTAHAILKRSCHIEVTLIVAKPAASNKKAVKGQDKKSKASTK